VEGVTVEGIAEGPEAAGRPGARAALVLVVDDDAAIRGLLAEALADAGYEVETAPDGAAALARAAARPPALVVLDSRMPGVDGPAFLRRYRAGGAAPAPVLGVAASAQGRAALVEAGVDAALAKPFALDALLALVARLLARDPGGP
jgi:two-component system OmpR family response regulator